MFFAIFEFGTVPFTHRLTATVEKGCTIKIHTDPQSICQGRYGACECGVKPYVICGEEAREKGGKKKKRIGITYRRLEIRPARRRIGQTLQDLAESRHPTLTVLLSRERAKITTTERQNIY